MFLLVLNVFFWLLVSYVLMSAIEYCAHRWVMHSKLAGKYRIFAQTFESHTLLHHARFYRNFRYDDDPAAKYVSIDLGFGYMVATTFPVWALLLIFFGFLPALVFMLFAGCHGALWSLVHREMHEPTGAWFANTALFKYWENYHKEHHERPSWNYNVLCPLFDDLMGTRW